MSFHAVGGAFYLRNCTSGGMEPPKGAGFFVNKFASCIDTFTRYIGRYFSTSGGTFLYIGRDFVVMISTTGAQNCTSGGTKNPRTIQY